MYEFKKTKRENVERRLMHFNKMFVPLQTLFLLYSSFCRTATYCVNYKRKNVLLKVFQQISCTTVYAVSHIKNRHFESCSIAPYCLNSYDEKRFHGKINNCFLPLQTLLPSLKVVIFCRTVPWEFQMILILRSQKQNEPE